MHIFRRVLLGLTLALFLAATVWFGARNTGPLTVNLLFGEPAVAPLWLWLAGVFAAGALLGLCVLLPALLRAAFALRRARRTLRELESEVHQLRNLPLEGAGAVPGHHGAHGENE